MLHVVISATWCSRHRCRGGDGGQGRSGFAIVRIGVEGSEYNNDDDNDDSDG